jgi:hypothetical protein
MFTTSKLARTIALPAISAAVLGGAALGLAGMANATAVGGQAPSGPGYHYSPGTYAKPAPTQLPGWHNHHGLSRIIALQGR